MTNSEAKLYLVTKLSKMRKVYEESETALDREKADKYISALSFLVNNFETLDNI